VSVQGQPNEQELQRGVKEGSADLREANRRKDVFLATLAHELRNTLAPLRNALQLVRIQEQELPPALREAHEMMGRQVDHLERLVDDLLDISRITRGKIKLEKERVDLAGVVARVLEGSQPLIDARQQRLEVDLPVEAVPVEADPMRLAQVFLNLLNNAAKYTPEGGQIWLTVRREENQVVVRVRDTGVGISAEMLPRVFDLFAQSERSLDRAEGGLGIGLPLVRRLTEMHGGIVEVFSAGPGRGSEFVVHLPVAPGPPPETTPAQSEAPDAQPGSMDRRILVVDDNRDAAESLALLLRLLGNEVRTAPDGRAALDDATADPPEAILLDIGLPGMDGLEVCRCLRRQAKLKKTLIVAISGYGGEADRRCSLEAGFDAHLVKPVDLDALQDLLTRGRAAKRAEA
jgi:CheY-like chemotaxis protein/nitrogen-specific signal transduction histidine kinase